MNNRRRRNLELQSQVTINRLVDHEFYKLAKQLILSKDRWEERLINNDEFEATIQNYNDILLKDARAQTWPDVEKKYAETLDMAVHSENDSVRKDMLRLAHQYSNGWIEQEELEQFRAMQRKKIAKARSQPKSVPFGKYSFY